MAVVFAMLASYLLSRTLVPTLVDAARARRARSAQPSAPASPGLFARLHAASNAASSGCATRMRAAHVDARARGLAVAVAARSCRRSLCCSSRSSGGTSSPRRRRADPAARARPAGHAASKRPSGSFQAVEDEIRRVIPPRELDLILDNIGMPASNYNLSTSDGSTVGHQRWADPDLLNEGHGPTADYMRKLRTELRDKFPDATFYLPARRHHHPDLELRPARADRRPGRRQRCRQQSACRARSPAADQGGARRGRRASAPDRRLPSFFVNVDRVRGVADRPDRAADRKSISIRR